MLVLSRKPGEKIIIDGHITVTVLKIDGKHVRIGIEAPPEVRVLREELMTEKRASHQPEFANVN